MEKNANRLVGIYQVEDGEDRGMSEGEEEEERIIKVSPFFSLFLLDSRIHWGHCVMKVVQSVLRKRLEVRENTRRLR